MKEDRGTGKTTRLMNRAIDELAELPEDANVYITGAHSPWLKTLERRFKESGLVNVVFLTIGEIKNGSLRGHMGTLLVDDPEDMSDSDWRMVNRERLYLKGRLNGRRTERLPD